MNNDFLLKETEIKKKVNRLQITGSVQMDGAIARIGYRRLLNDTVVDEGLAKVPAPAVQFDIDGNIDVQWLNGVINHPDFDNLEALNTWEQHLADQEGQ